MALPRTIRVKLSSEAAEAISITAVVVEELPLRELVEHILGVIGKEERRIQEILRRGTLVSGASRFRWEGWEPEPGGLRELLATFPDPDPTQPFAAGRCVRAVLGGGRQPIEIPREAAARKPLFRRETFWDVLMEIAAASSPAYTGYSYRERADRYRHAFTASEAERLRGASAAVRYSTLRDRIRTVEFRHADLYATR